MIKETTHPEKLLPWYVNGTLSLEEKSLVEKHLEDCTICHDELEFLKTLQKQIQTEQPVPAPGKFGLNRLLRDIKKQKKTKKNRPVLWLPSFATAAAIVIVVQSVLLINVYDSQPGNIVPLAGTFSEKTLQIRFAPTANEKQIREILQLVNATLVDGPGALGIYQIRLNESNDQESSIEGVIDKLKAKPNVVIYVEKAYPSEPG